MPKTLSITAEGAVSINFGDNSLNFALNDPLIPADVASYLNATHAALIGNGASLIHMEQDTYRTFTHIQKAGLVSHAPAITDPAFAFVMNREQQLMDAMGVMGGE